MYRWLTEFGLAKTENKQTTDTWTEWREKQLRHWLKDNSSLRFIRKGYRILPEVSRSSFVSFEYKFFIAPDIRCMNLKYANIPAVHNSFRVLLTNTKPFQKSIIKTSNLLSRVGLANIWFKYPSYFELY